MIEFPRKQLSRRSFPILDRWLHRARQVSQTTWFAIRSISILTAFLWVVEFANTLLAHRLNYFGIYPRELEALPGILVWPFLHAGYPHLLVNSLPLLVLGFFVALRGLRVFLFATVTIQITAGFAVWMFGREAFHIGASGLVFGYFGMLVALAWFDRRLSSFLIAALMLLTYGGMLWGVVPRDSFVSWEGHLFGLIAGVLAANLIANNKGKLA